MNTEMIKSMQAFNKTTTFELKVNSDPIKGTLSFLSKKPPKIPAFPATLDTYKDTKISERLKTLR